MIQDTSLMAYQSIQDNLGQNQLLVYLMLKNLGAANNKILARKLGWSINSVTPRIKELREKGLVFIDSKRICPITYRETGEERLTYFWTASDSKRSVEQGNTDSMKGGAL